MKESAYEGQLPNREPQAPRQVSIDQADRGSRDGNKAYNPGGEPHGGRCTRAGETSND